MASLLYGAGSRLQECLMLRVKDVDFVRRQIHMHDGKAAKDRVTMLPEGVVQPLQAHLGKVRGPHRRGPADSYVEVWSVRMYPVRRRPDRSSRRGNRQIHILLTHGGRSALRAATMAKPQASA